MNVTRMHELADAIDMIEDNGRDAPPVVDDINFVHMGSFADSNSGCGTSACACGVAVALWHPTDWVDFVAYHAGEAGGSVMFRDRDGEYKSLQTIGRDALGLTGAQAMHIFWDLSHHDARAVAQEIRKMADDHEAG